MIYLLLSILSSTAIVVIFRLIGRFNVALLLPIVINYITASVAGFALHGNFFEISDMQIHRWLWIAALIGIMFIVMFYIIGLSAQKSGLAVTSVASKMSVIIPILFSIFFYGEAIDFIKIMGILLALVAVMLTIYRKNGNAIDNKFIVLPLILFVGAGIIDIFVKVAQAEYVTDEILPVFSAILFAFAGICGIVAAFFMKIKIIRFLHPKVLIFGISLGLCNLGSIYFIIKALNHSGLDSSIVFGVNNVGMVILSLIVALTFFKEKFSWVNYIGIFTALIAIAVLLFR